MFDILCTYSQTRSSIIMCTLLDLSKENLNDLIENGKVLTAWRQASECLEYFKAIEMKLRKELVAQNFAESKKGKNVAELENGTLEYTKSYTTKVEEEDFSEVAKMLEDEFVDVGALFKIKHSLVASEYNKLEDNAKEIVDKILVVKEDSPKLIFKPSVID